MKPSNELFDLIKAMTKSEKRFFKLSSSLQSGEKNYLKIFDAVDKLDEYDEAELKHQFRNERFVLHFPSEKNHLYKLILKSLRAFHADNSISAILKQEIKNIEILYNKALYSECTKFLHRAKELAREYEKFYYWFELLNWEKTLMEEAFEDGRFVQKPDDLIIEEQDVIKKLNNLAEYHVLYSKINYVFRSGGYSRDNESKALVDEIANHRLITGKNTALSKRAASICYYTQGFCHLANHNFNTAYEKFLKAKEILDKVPGIRADLGKRYIRTMAHIAFCLIERKQFDKATEVIAEIRSFSDQKGFSSPDVNMAIFKNALMCEIQIYLRTGRFADGVARIEEAFPEFSSREEKLNKEQRVTFYYHIAYVYFGNEDYHKALFWINKVLNENENDLRPDLFAYARLFNLIVHFELGNYDLLEYITKSTKRYLAKRHRAYPLENHVIEKLRQLIRTEVDTDKRGKYKEFHDSLNEVMRPEDEIALKHFDFVSWADAKVKGISFAAAVADKSKQIG